MNTNSGRHSRRWYFMEGFQVSRDGKPHLDRMRLLQTPLGGVYLHRIHNPDPDPDPHDHPWPFLSVVLFGWYTEEVYCVPGSAIRRYHGRWRPLFLPLRRAHKIIEVSPLLWTLVFTGPKRNNWGFWVGDRRVPWQQYLGVSDEDKALWG